MAIFLNFVVKTAKMWLVLGGFFCVFSQSDTICNLHSCYKYKFALVLQQNCTPFLANQSIFFVYIINQFSNRGVGGYSEEGTWGKRDTNKSCNVVGTK